MLYRTQLPATDSPQPLQLTDIRDFALVYLDGRQIGTLDRHFNQTALTLPLHDAARLDILIENTGRLNSTKQMRLERKGMTAATLAGTSLTNWQIYSIPASQPLAAQGAKPGPEGPRYASGQFTLATVGDTFLDVGQLGKA